MHISVANSTLTVLCLIGTARDQLIFLFAGGIREPAFVHWPGQVAPATRTSSVVSSLDVLPTLSKLIGADLPPNLVIDGKDMSEVCSARTE